MFLNLAERDPAILLSSLYEALRDGPDTITIELLGPGIMLHDTALMLFEVLRNRPTHIHIHAHSHTCLSDGALLIWLAANTRSIRCDAWIQLCHVPKTPKPHCKSFHSNYTSGIHMEDEQPADTDLRTVMRHLDEWLPVSEIEGMRLFEKDLRDLALIEDSENDQNLATLFAGNNQS
jgi:hypothetical protein